MYDRSYRSSRKFGPLLFGPNYFGPHKYLGSSLNAVVVFNLEVTHAARFALKTTTAYNEEPKKEKLARKAEENGRI